MANKITFLTKIFIIILSITLSSYALELKIVPLKKPLLNEEVKKSKILKNIIKPKEKPQKKIVTTEETIDEKKIKPKETIRPNNVKYGKSFLNVNPKFGILSEGSTMFHLKIVYK